MSKWKSGKTSGLDACVWGLGLGCGWGLDASVSNRETHVESGTNQKDAWRKKKAINQTKDNHKKFQNLTLTTFFLRREPPLLYEKWENIPHTTMLSIVSLIKHATFILSHSKDDYFLP